MNNYFFNEYQKKMFVYCYKFFLLGEKKYSKQAGWTHKLLSYRYWAETDTFHPSITEDIGAFPNQRQETFSITLNLLLPEPYLAEEIEKLKKQVSQEARAAKEEELKIRCKREGSEYLKTPPAHWEFYKKQDINPEKAQQTFHNWDRIITVYKLNKEGIKPKGILQQANKFFTHLSEELNNANQYRRIREDIKEAEKLIESTIKGTFPITD